ncbi:hypothetical protein B0A50_04447 [Salinomyces thailandicus]|uniref:Uncharacterized protein n=1 Tax=Salinomyces thailandicus TaxID=706561 RepID=A0A4U0U0L8_9PEZI|nr:hypothetical protein B0A50_04447 [Salinomyces thailandica]
MSYYPSLDGNVPTYTSTASGAIPTASGPANANHADPSFAPEPPLASLSSSKKRKPSKSKSAKQLSRSVSTPQLFGSSIMSDFDDKKRNKLGYQRISIACA